MELDCHKVPFQERNGPFLRESLPSLNEGNLDIVKQKLDGDPIYYNRGGNITAVMPSNGEDIYVIARGDVTLSGVDTTGGPNGEVGRLVVSAGVHFKIMSDDGNSVFGCGGFGGLSCAETINANSGPGQPFEGEPGGPFPPSGTITLNGAKARVISLGARDIVVNGTLQAVDDPTTLAAPAILLTAANSITVNAQLKTDQSVVEPNYGLVNLVAPTINVNSKITSDAVTLQASANDVASTGSITTAAIDARVYITMNAGSIIYNSGGGGGGAIAAAQPAASFDPGDFSIKTGKLTAARYILLGATANIDTGAIELLENNENVPLGAQDVRIHANVGKANAPTLNIGGGGNGAASITVHGTNELSLDKNRGVIYVSNGPSGDITLDGSNIHTFANSHGVQSLIANAGTGKITLKGAPIAVDGNASVSAGSIVLMGDEVRSNGTTLSASDTMSTAETTPPQIIIAASQLTLTGDLTAQANGNKLTGVQLVPKGSYVDDPLSYYEGQSIRVKPDVTPTENQVLISGSGNLNLNAKSEKAQVTLSGKPFKFNTSGTSNIKADGKETKISVDYAGSSTGINSLVFSNGKVNFYADGLDNANGGEISIHADGVKTQTGADLGLYARAMSDGNGGTVTINAAKVNLGDSMNLVDVSAKASTGNGGNITMSSTGTAVMDVSNAIIKANGSSTGDAGNISITANQILVANAAFRANAQNTGTGGEIDLVLTGPNKALDLSQADIQAMGGENGSGGTLSMTDIVPLDDPEAHINVYAEPALIPAIVAQPVNPQAGPAGTGGVVKVTKLGITCQFYKTPGFTWPKGYWNCAHPGGATDEDKAVVSVTPNLSVNDQNTLKSSSIYVWASLNDFKKFTGRTVKDPLEAGHAYVVGTNKGYLNVFESTPKYPTLSLIQLRETAGHELGHLNDYLQNHSGRGDYLTFIQHDFQTLDYDVLGVSAATSHLRNPCDTSPFDNKPGPLVGIFDQSTQIPFCSGTQIETKWRDPNNFGAPYRISYILREAAPYYYKNNDELYAQHFAWVVYAFTVPVAVPPTWFIYTVDGMDYAGHFSCTVAWASAVKDGVSVPPAAPGCSSVQPWYIPKLGEKSSHD